MFKYIQSTGQLFHQEDGKWVLIGTGYSGHDDGLNNHAMENVSNVGPIPAGLWSISPPYDDEHLGTLCFRYVALTYMGPRYSFRLHGDNKELNHTASDGCTIFDHATRQKIADLKPKYLLVEA